MLTESLPTVRSVAIGFWVGVGSRDEVPSLSGSSHYLEHLLFKGTPSRDALAISSAFDEVGGEANAFTEKEYTCFYARVLDADLPMALDVLCDMVSSSLLRAAELAIERTVILDEIAMHDDDPADVVHDQFARAMFGDHPLGRPVIGTTDSIRRLTRSQINGFYRRRYTAPSIVVAAAGNLDHGVLTRRLRRALSGTGLLDGAGEPDPPRRSTGAPPPLPAAIDATERRTEQAHVVLGMRAPGRHDDERFTLAVLDNALGGGMSSRLFQEIRERRGLAYSVYSFSSHYADAGVFGVYAGCAPDKVDDVLALSREALHDVADRGLTDAEIARSKGQLRGGLVLGLEDPGSRMSRLGKGELVYGEVRDVDALLARIDAVTPDDVRDLAGVLASAPLALGVIGAGARSTLDAAVRA